MALKTIGAGTASALLLAAAGCASPDSIACRDNDPTVVCTADGPVRGTVDHGVLAVKGIPYAAPPTGPRRWQSPAPPDPWTAVRDGSRFGAICPQLAGANVTGDEDCLTVNVWTPRPAPARSVPVMVFFTGGGNHAFSGQGAGVFGGVQYNGDRLVPEGVVFVSFNNRLGALGFLAHEAPGADRLTGNYGSLDQIALLRWIQRNIAAFGGDPKRVFAFGTSAGGANVCALMTAPASRGLFQGAAMQSSVPTGCEIATLADVQAEAGARVALALGCDGPAAASCLRAKPMDDIVRAVPGSFGVFPRLYGPNVDGAVFPEQPLLAIRRGAHSAMPVIVGNSAQETMQFVGGLGPVPDRRSYEAAVRTVFGASADRIVSQYPVTNYPTPRDALVRVTTDGLFTCQSRRVARALAHVQPQPVYRYLFDHRLDNDPLQRALGATHTIEHPFFFAWQGHYRPNDTDLAIQRLLIGHWTSLAREGTLTSWAPGGDAYLRISDRPLSTRDDDARCDFWDTVTLPWPHL